MNWAKRREGMRRAWARMTPEQRAARGEAIRAGLARRQDVLGPEEQAYLERLARRRQLRDLGEADAGARCGVCGLLQPHECLDGAQVVASEPAAFPVRAGRRS